MNPIKVAGIVLGLVLVGAIFATPGMIGAGAAHPDQSDQGQTESETTTDTETEQEVRIVDEEIVIADGIVTIADTTLKGPGLEEQHIEDRTYTVDSTVKFDGFHLTHDGTHYTICRITVHVQDIGIHLQNVTLTDGGTDSSGHEPTESCDEC